MNKHSQTQVHAHVHARKHAPNASDSEAEIYLFLYWGVSVASGRFVISSHVILARIRYNAWVQRAHTLTHLQYLSMNKPPLKTGGHFLTRETQMGIWYDVITRIT